MKYRIGLLLTSSIVLPFVITVHAQSKSRFPQENDLQSCEINVPLYYATKNQKALIEAAEKYKDVEMVLVTIDKKKGPSYRRYYLIRHESPKLGSTAYLIYAENKGKRPDEIRGMVAIFLDYNPKKHIFYNAECFRGNAVSKLISEEK